MKISNHFLETFICCLALGLVSSTCHAEIYKWIDANGKTHFSERKDIAGKAREVGLNSNSQPTSTQATKSTSEYWQEQETLFKQRQMQNPQNIPTAPSLATKPKALSDGRADDSNASRCNLARDVLSGAVKHPNGAPTDKYDREVAENDVRAYCR